jgi:hypothetical protein
VSGESENESRSAVKAKVRGCLRRPAGLDLIAGLKLWFGIRVFLSPEQVAEGKVLNEFWVFRRPLFFEN